MYIWETFTNSVQSHTSGHLLLTQKWNLLFPETSYGSTHVVTFYHQSWSRTIISLTQNSWWLFDCTFRDMPWCVSHTTTTTQISLIKRKCLIDKSNYENRSIDDDNDNTHAREVTNIHSQRYSENNQNT